MNSILKNNLLRVAILLLFLFTVSQVCMASEEVPLLPMTIQGTVLVDGTPAPTGTIVADYLNGEQVGKSLVDSSSGEYYFWISGTAADEGKPITFTVNGKDTGKILTWKSGKQVLSFQLSVGKGVKSEDFIKSLTSTINSESLTKIENPKAPGKVSEAKIIEDSVPEPDLNVLKSMSASSLGKEAEKSAEGSFGLKSLPGFTIAFAVAGIIVLIFGFNLVRKRG
jgi:hypothetical protein